MTMGYYPKICACKLKLRELALLTGRSRSTVYEWVAKNGLPIADDKRVELAAFIRWFESYIEGRRRRCCRKAPRIGSAGRVA